MHFPKLLEALVITVFLIGTSTSINLGPGPAVDCSKKKLKDGTPSPKLMCKKDKQYKEPIYSTQGVCATGSELKCCIAPPQVKPELLKDENCTSPF
ncbi:hypothetical protein PGT21_009220 [Puccinia graminis f. sp. tritici]|uniref:Uncharacterized protein n=1 Tax=Puccinia graminis f. sp. tritici TaxID=56615 RepID=A0A5B0LSE7_PUCGR|nr:hypothetical protein PGTUg99_027178 [Puccinia graminis f. sp. tritici]KAA1083853.1 hypothetical protein PGT21_009220 [Puccinia graminis f. sp. tritici]